MAPRQGPRHRSWASDTNLSIVFAAVIVVGYIVWELVGEAPQGMITLVGVAGGALFGALSGDKRKRDDDTERTAERAAATAERAEVKADMVADATGTTVSDVERRQDDDGTRP